MHYALFIWHDTSDFADMLFELLFLQIYDCEISLSCTHEIKTSIIFFPICVTIITLNIWTVFPLANNINPDQTAPKEQSDQDLHCLPHHLLA